MESLDNKAFVYEFGKFVLDPNEKTLFADGYPVHLPAKEFETLQLLVENNGRALSKEEMMSTIWQDSFVEEGNLAKQISKLRKIFDSNGDQFIETIPKHGYRFKADLHRTITALEESIVVEKRTVKRVTFAVENDVDASLALKGGSKSFLTAPRIAGSCLILAIVVGAIWLWGSRTSPKTTTIAVLPIRSLSSEENDRILAAGLTDALITKLGSLKGVIVRPANSVEQFANTGAEPTEIGRKLDVQLVLEGTILQVDRKLRFNMRLINAQTGSRFGAKGLTEPLRMFSRWRTVLLKWPPALCLLGSLLSPPDASRNTIPITRKHIMPI